MSSVASEDSCLSGLYRGRRSALCCLFCGAKAGDPNAIFGDKSPFSDAEVVPWYGGTPSKPKGEVCYACGTTWVKGGWHAEFKTKELPPRSDSSLWALLRDI